MNENSPESIKPLPDTTNVLTALSSNDGTLSLTLSVDKSVTKVAAWAMGVIIGSGMLIGAGIILAIWMIIAYRETEREVRLSQYDIQMLRARLEAKGVNTDSH